MSETISNMELAELGIVCLAAIAGIFVGYLTAVIRRFLKDRKFKSEENQIKKQVRRMSLGQIQKLSEDGKLYIDPAIKALLEKIDVELNNIEVHNRERSEIEDDINELSSVLQQLSNA